MDFTGTKVKVRFYLFGKCACSERNDVNTAHLVFFVPLKTTKKDKKRKLKNKSSPVGDRGSFDQ